MKLKKGINLISSTPKGKNHSPLTERCIERWRTHYTEH